MSVVVVMRVRKEGDGCFIGGGVGGGDNDGKERGEIVSGKNGSNCED